MEKISCRAIMPLFFLLLVFDIHTPQAAAQTPTPLSHMVAPGDTWTALAWRYGLDVHTLQSAYGHINRQRQPTIGTTLLLPGTAVQRSGTILHPTDSLLKTAVSHNLSPWTLAALNHITSPYQPALGQALFVPDGDQPVRELPNRFTTLAFSQIPATPGQAIGFRAKTDSSTPVSARLGSAAMDVFTNGRFLVAITGTGAFYGAGEPELSITTESGLWSQPWRFVDDEWDFQEITLTGTAAAIDQAAIQAERERLFVIWNQATGVPQWDAPFHLPIDSYLSITSDFGARRSYNGGPYSTYHEGVDFAAYGGTPVTAPAVGTVVIAEMLFVRGGAVIIDHGLGIYSGYYHMADVAVEPGQVITPGQVLGEVGTTGLSTGNHLHWDLLVNSIWVDAAAFYEQDMACWILAGMGQPCDN